jgi:hypothetical protein
MLHVVLAALLAAAPAPTPAPTPISTPSPAPALIVGGDFTIYAFHTAGVNALGALDTLTGVDLPDRADLSNLLLNISATSGKWRANATIGEYAFPTLGAALNPDLQSGTNVNLYSALPVAALTYNFDSHVSMSVGKFAALLGQESPFTFQNVNVQRGIGWAMEPTISRGVQAAYANGPLTLTLQENDGYYSGRNRAFEGLIGYAPAASTTVQFAAIVPGANTPPNSTVAIANKAEYDLMFTQQVGKLQLLPYFLWVNSPASATLGYAQSERATAGVLIATWAFSTPWSIALRYETVRNNSSATDTNPNADLVGYGPGSGARSFTATPAFHFPGNGVLRLEYSSVSLSSFTPGLGFGANGLGASQSRVGFEVGVMH